MNVLVFLFCSQAFTGNVGGTLFTDSLNCPLMPHYLAQQEDPAARVGGSWNPASQVRQLSGNIPTSIPIPCLGFRALLMASRPRPASAPRPRCPRRETIPRDSPFPQTCMALPTGKRFWAAETPSFRSMLALCLRG